MSATCITIREGGKSRGTPCGRRIVGYVAPGQGRCGYHMTERERLRTLAIVRSIREMRELRGFDAAGFADAALDEE